MLQNFYDPAQGRLVLPEGFSDPKKGAYTSDYNSIYPDCQDDIDEAFGLTLPKPPKEMYQLTKAERTQVIEKLKKFSRYPDAIMPGEGIKDFRLGLDLIKLQFIRNCIILTICFRSLTK